MQPLLWTKSGLVDAFVVTVATLGVFVAFVLLKAPDAAYVPTATVAGAFIGAKGVIGGVGAWKGNQNPNGESNESHA